MPAIADEITSARQWGIVTPRIGVLLSDTTIADEVQFKNDPTGLSVPLVPGFRYMVDGYIAYNSVSATVGLNLTSPEDSLGSYAMIGLSGASGVADSVAMWHNGDFGDDDTMPVSGVNARTAVLLSGYIKVNSYQESHLRVRFAQAEAAISTATTIYAGSWIRAIAWDTYNNN